MKRKTDAVKQKLRSVEESEASVHHTEDEISDYLQMNYNQNVHRWRYEKTKQPRQLIIEQTMQRHIRPHVLRQNVVVHNRPETRLEMLEDIELEPHYIDLPDKEYVIDKHGKPVEMPKGCKQRAEYIRECADMQHEGEYRTTNHRRMHRPGLRVGVCHRCNKIKGRKHRQYEPNYVPQRSYGPDAQFHIRYGPNGPELVEGTPSSPPVPVIHAHVDPKCRSRRPKPMMSHYQVPEEKLVSSKKKGCTTWCGDPGTFSQESLSHTVMPLKCHQHYKSIDELDPRNILPYGHHRW